MSGRDWIRSPQRNSNEDGVHEEISQLSAEVRGLYRLISSKNSPPSASKMIFEPSGIDFLVSDLIADLSSNIINFFC